MFLVRGGDWKGWKELVGAGLSVELGVMGSVISKRGLWSRGRVRILKGERIWLLGLNWQ